MIFGKTIYHIEKLMKHHKVSYFWQSPCIVVAIQDAFFYMERRPLSLRKEGHKYCWFQSVEGENHERAVELLKAASGSVKLVVRYTPRVLEEMEMRFDKQRASRRRTSQLQ